MVSSQALSFPWILCPVSRPQLDKSILGAPRSPEQGVSCHCHLALLFPILRFWLQLVSGCLDRQTELVQLSR